MVATTLPYTALSERMCRYVFFDVAVMDLQSMQVLNVDLLPGYIRKGGDFRWWMKLRYASNTNTLARKLLGLGFAHSGMREVDTQTRAFSLSDCYWMSSDPWVYNEG